ncbi:hypothetical protein CLOACE_04750 [Clostridium acetireducens DSM 10703]|uniref:CRISPR-associated protein n=1 Tax=Clostridium acetireducens DSM 10703 TaxID=1121290 RepID=A0A1E8F0W5_9CLOT|nr:CRISPR-associated protein Csx20 [Clostridium acetireducens]OFI07070.1 hypothetical protein CLOACE_04750 [Clostridium acetireducens DSM 10703]
MKNMFLLFSHTLTEEQVKDAKENFGIKEFIYLPKELQKMWSNVPIEEYSYNYEKPFINFLENNATEEDLVLIEGEYGITFKIVNWCLNNNLKAVYSCTKREFRSNCLSDGKIQNVHFFKHIRFKVYEF